MDVSLYADSHVPLGSSDVFEAVAVNLGELGELGELETWDLEVWGEVSGCCARSFTWWRELQKRRHAGPWTWSEWRFSHAACQQPKSIFLYIFPSFYHISSFAFLNSLLNIFQHPTWTYKLHVNASTHTYLYAVYLPFLASRAFWDACCMLSKQPQKKGPMGKPRCTDYL